MLRGFATILIKELKELIRDPKILVGIIVLPLVIFPVLGLVLGYAVESAQEQAQRATLVVVNNDGGNWSQTFIGYVNQTMNVAVISDTTPQQVVSQNLLPEYNSTQFVEIPAGFSQNMTQHTNGNLTIATLINVYGVFQGGGIFSNIGLTGINSIVNGFNSN